jgi:hypothetical protein
MKNAGLAAERVSSNSSEPDSICTTAAAHIYFPQ